MICIIIVLLVAFCQQRATVNLVTSIFVDTPTSAAVKAGVIDEVSGIADSRANPGFLWAEQDSGNPPEISLLAYNGALLKRLYIKGATNRDWEDIAVARGPDASAYYVYLAETGDNSLQYPNYAIYRFKEPASSADTVTAVDKIAFNYPDGSHDAEAFFVDNDSKDIFIITKNDVTTSIYKLAYPQSTTAISEASLVGSLPLKVVVGASISPDGKEVIVKTYTSLNYWKRTGGESIEDVLKKPAIALAYQLEIQGEAVGFKNDNSGFFTLSEKPSISSAVFLNFYKRN